MSGFTLGLKLHLFTSDLMNASSSESGVLERTQAFQKRFETTRGRGITHSGPSFVLGYSARNGKTVRFVTEKN